MTAPFSFHLSWTQALLANPNVYDGPAEPAWSQHERYGRTCASVWGPNVPHAGTATLFFWPDRMKISNPRAFALDLASILGSFGPNGAGLTIGAVAPRFINSHLDHTTLASLEGVSSLKPSGFPAVGCWLGAAPNPNGTLTWDGPCVHGSGALDGTWDAMRFFAADSRRALRLTHSRPCDSRALRDLFGVGAIAFALGALITWMEQRTSAAITTDSDPLDGLDAPVRALVVAYRETYGFEGPGIESTPQRDAAVYGSHACPLSQEFRHRSRLTSRDACHALATEMADALMSGLRESRTWVPDQGPNASGWRAMPTLQYFLGCAEKMGATGAVEHGRAFGAAVAPKASNVGAYLPALVAQ